MIWIKNKGGTGLQAKQKHIKIHENIIVFSNSSSYTYNPMKWNVSEDFIIKRKTFTFTETNNIIDSIVEHEKSKDDGTRNPISVLPYKVPYSPKRNSRTRNGDYRVHPTQKPLALMEYLVRTYTNENDLVLDNCMGSGTTGLACKNLGRNFIGIEKDGTYYKIAEERLGISYH